MKGDIIEQQLSHKINGLCFQVFKKLGRFCRERQYQDALEDALRQAGIKYVREYELQKFDAQSPAGNRVDFLIEDRIILDCKAKAFITKEDYYQMQRYLRAVGLKLGLIVNFRQIFLKPKRVLDSSVPTEEVSHHSHLFRNFALGFTLIELLTVITIIGILTTIVSVNVSSSRKQARDARRKSDIKAIQTSLELYYNANQQFPALPWGTNSNKDTWNNLRVALAPYLSLPSDPTNNALDPWAAGGLAYGYASADWRGCNQGQWYVLIYGLEDTKDSAIAKSPGVRMCDGTTYNETSKGNIIVVGQAQ